MNRELILKWLDLLLSSETGEVMYIPVEDKNQQKALLKSFRSEISIMSEVDPERSTKIKLSTTVHDSRLWVTLEKVAGTPLVGFIKKKDGTTERVSIEDPGRQRRLTAMKEDGYTLQQVVEIEGELSKEEADFIKGGN